MVVILTAECIVKGCLQVHGAKVEPGQVHIHDDERITITCPHKENYGYFSVFNPLEQNSGAKILWFNKKYLIPPRKKNVNWPKKNVNRRGKWELCFLHGLVCPQYDYNTGKGRCF